MKLINENFNILVGSEIRNDLFEKEASWGISKGRAVNNLWYLPLLLITLPKSVRDEYERN